MSEKIPFLIIVLSQPISEEEVYKDVWTLHLDKALVPDGFSINFYRKRWPTIKKYLIKMLNWTRDKEKIRGATNSSFLSLIPKDKNPTSIKCFRPISLCNSSNNILTKIISSRLKNLISKLISTNQGGFIAGRQIFDIILMV